MAAANLLSDLQSRGRTEPGRRLQHGRPHVRISQQPHERDLAPEQRPDHRRQLQRRRLLIACGRCWRTARGARQRHGRYQLPADGLLLPDEHGDLWHVGHRGPRGCRSARGCRSQDRVDRPHDRSPGSPGPPDLYRRLHRPLHGHLLQRDGAADPAGHLHDPSLCDHRREHHAPTRRHRGPLAGPAGLGRGHRHLRRDVRHRRGLLLHCQQRHLVRFPRLLRVPTRRDLRRIVHGGRERSDQQHVFDWSVGRYATHDGFGGRTGGKALEGQGGGAGIDTQCSAGSPPTTR